MIRGTRLVLAIAAGLLASWVALPVASAHTVVQNASALAHQTVPQASQDPINNGTPFSRFTAPGVIPAAEFNHGGSEVAYAWNASSGGNDQAYRPTTTVPISSQAGTRYITSVAATTGSFVGYVKNYVKYTFQVHRPGWFHLAYDIDSASGGTVTTLVDGIQEGQSPVLPVGSTFSPVRIASDIYLSSGSHVFMVVFNDPNIRLAAMAWSRTSAPLLPTPTIIDGASRQSDPFVAQAVVTNPLFGADPTGQRDSTAAIQHALSLVGATGGGVVYVPPGIYKMQGPLVVPENTILRGAWSPPGIQSLAQETLFEVTGPGGNAKAPAFITLGSPNAGVRDINVWYPHQDPSAPVAYPPTIAGPTYSPSVMDVTFYGAYTGIQLTGARRAR